MEHARILCLSPHMPTFVGPIDPWSIYTAGFVCCNSAQDCWCMVWRRCIIPFAIWHRLTLRFRWSPHKQRMSITKVSYCCQPCSLHKTMRQTTRGKLTRVPPGKVIEADIIAELFDESTDEAKKGGATGMDGITMKVWKVFFYKKVIDMVRDFMQKIYIIHTRRRKCQCAPYTLKGV